MHTHPSNRRIPSLCKRLYQLLLFDAFEPDYEPDYENVYDGGDEFADKFYHPSEDYTDEEIDEMMQQQEMEGGW